VELEEGAEITLSPERLRELQAKEQFILTVTNGGFGKRTSAYEYRITGRGGQGVTNMGLTPKNGGEVVASFPVTDSHQVMLISDAGQMIRMPVSGCALHRPWRARGYAVQGRRRRKRRICRVADTGRRRRGNNGGNGRSLI
jgi:DNA gyrase/topoisomerase IV subunit A